MPLLNVPRLWRGALPDNIGNGFFLNAASLGLATRLTLKKKNGAQCMSNIYISLQAVYMFKTLRIRQLTTTSTWKKIVIQDN